MSQKTKNALINIGNSIFDLNFCSFRIETETKEMMDPYDLTKTVKVKINNLIIYDAVSQSSNAIKLINPDDATIKLITGYLKSKGIALNAIAGKFEYANDTVGV